MTTIIGIKTTSGSVDAVVMGADTRLVYFDDHDKPVGYRTCKKFIYAEGAPWIMTHSGMETPEYYRFRRELVGTLERALGVTEALTDLTEGRVPRTRVPFEPIAELFRREQEEKRDWYSTIFLATATSDNGTPRLWYFDRGGVLRPCPDGRNSKDQKFAYLVTGGGRHKVRKIFRRMQQHLDPDSITFEHAINLIEMGLFMAQDSFTKGYQLAVVTSEGVCLSPQFKKYLPEFSPYCGRMIEQYMGEQIVLAKNRSRCLILKENIVINTPVF